MNFKVSDINVENKNPDIENKNNIDLGKFDIQSIDNDTLEKIFNEEYLNNPNIPNKKEIIAEELQTEYFKKTKDQIISKLQKNRFSIISGPTGTGKTTLAKTIAYESGLPFYEVIGDDDKSLGQFLEEIKTIIKGNVPQIKSIPGSLLKALTGGGIFCINEANFLENDIVIAIANLIENGFIVWQGKKYKIHPNFSLIFTSNDGYIGTKSYNSAVIRKAGGISVLEYENKLSEEFILVKSLYETILPSIDNSNTISKEVLEKITFGIFNIRNSLNKASIDKNKKFYTESAGNYADYFYIRLYQKIIKELLISGKIDLKNAILNLGFIPKMNPYIGGTIISNEYIEKIDNDIEFFTDLLDRECDIFNVKNDSNIGIEDELKLLLGFGGNKDSNEGNKDSNEGNKNNWEIKKNKSFNPDSFRKILSNKTKSSGEVLKRLENIEDIAKNFYEVILESKNKKLIEIFSFKDSKLKITINEIDIYLTSESKDVLEKLKNIGKSKNIEDFRKYVFGNFDIIYQYKEEGQFYNFPYRLSNPKSFEIRRRNKIVRFEKNGKKYVAFVGFKGFVSDIRYVGEKSSKYYIPQSKVSDVIFSLYEEGTMLQKNLHSLIINDDNIIKRVASFEIGDEDKTLHRIENNDEVYKKFEEEIRQKYSNIDKLNLQNGGIEKKYTGTPVQVIFNQYDIQSKILDILGRSLNTITESTGKILLQIHKSFLNSNDVLLTGESGTGKTSLVKYFAKSQDLPYISIQIPEDFNEQDLKSTYNWNEGAVEENMQAFFHYYVYGGVVELKEINMALMSTFLNQYMDENGTINFKGKLYRRNASFIIIATRNPFDPISYPGTNPMNDATLARFNTIFVDELNEEETKEVIEVEIQKENSQFIDNIGGQEVFDKIFKNLFIQVNSIRENINNLRLSNNDLKTNEVLLIYLKIKLTIDKLEFLFTKSTSLEDFKSNLIGMLNLEQKDLNLLKGQNLELYTIISQNNCLI